MTPRDLLLTHKSALENLIAANRAAKVDRIDRLRLDGITAQACRYLRRVQDGLKPGNTEEYARLLGANGHGPAMDDLVKQSADVRRGHIEFVEDFRIGEAA